MAYRALNYLINSLVFLGGYIGITTACILMLNIILGYSSFKKDVQFLVFKQAYLGNLIWETAFYIHVFSAVLVLFAGFTQFSRSFIESYKKWHRLIGKIYIWNILIINFPCAMILAVYANGGLLGKTAFILLDILWFWFTYKAFANARAGDYIMHQCNMIRSYSLTLSAITLRSWHIVLISLLNLEYNTMYIIQAWLSFVPNILIAELIVMRIQSKLSY